MLGKVVIGCLFSSIIFSTAFAAENNDDNNIKKVVVDVCNPQDNITNNLVKYISGDLFLDNIGNKVKPCSQNNEVVFKIIDRFENGKFLFNKSENKILNQLPQSEKINVNYDTPYTISYGENNLIIEDTESFQQSIKAVELDKVAIVVSNDNLNISPNDVYLLLNIPSNLSLPDKYKNMILEEKTNLINEKYASVIKQLYQLIQTEDPIQYELFKKTLINQNRILLLNDSIIKQYPIVNNENKDDFIVNGSSYDLFLIEKTKKDVYIASQKVIKDFISNPSNSVDSKLAFIDYLTEISNIFKKIENTIHQEKFNEWSSYRENINELNEKGIKEFKSSNEENKNKYFELIKEVNELIIENELNNLPDKLTKDQYNALSNIDKYKYKPELIGKFINTKVYLKANVIDVLKLKINK